MQKTSNNIFRKSFNLKDAQKILNLCESNASNSGFEMYIGLDKSSIGRIKNNYEAIKFVVNNWKMLPLDTRKTMLDNAIWDGTDYKNSVNVEKLNKQVGEKNRQSLQKAMSLKQSQAFVSYNADEISFGRYVTDLKDQKIILNILKKY